MYVYKYTTINNIRSTSQYNEQKLLNIGHDSHTYFPPGHVVIQLYFKTFDGKPESLKWQFSLNKSKFI